MSEHLSSREMEEWVIGQREGDAEGHLRVCGQCAEAVQRLTIPFTMFGDAVREWGEQTARVPLGKAAGPESRVPGWRLALVAGMLLMMIGAPVYRREEMKRQAAVMAAQDEILLREVEVGISRSVPVPMEPLARLMSSDVGRRTRQGEPSE